MATTLSKRQQQLRKTLQFSALSRPGRCRHNNVHVSNLVLELDTTRKHSRDIDHLVNALQLGNLLDF